MLAEERLKVWIRPKACRILSKLFLGAFQAVRCSYIWCEEKVWSFSVRTFELYEQEHVTGLCSFSRNGFSWYGRVMLTESLQELQYFWLCSLKAICLGIFTIWMHVEFIWDAWMLRKIVMVLIPYVFCRSIYVIASNPLFSAMWQKHFKT